MAFDLFKGALMVAGLFVLGMGLVVLVGSVRFWWEGRKSIRETERILRGRHR